MTQINVGPPEHPPPLLDEDQIVRLARHGYLRVKLSSSLSRLLERLSEAAETFFSLERNEKHNQYPAHSGTELGYYHIDGEKEYVSLRSRTKVNPMKHDLENLAAATWEETGLLLWRALYDLSLALDIEPDTWNPLISGCTTMPNSCDEDLPTLLRLFNYCPSTGIAERHTDIGLLTFCFSPSPGPGLEVIEYSSDDQTHLSWQDVSRADDGSTLIPSAVILVGETLRILSGRRLNAGVHRVVGNPEGRSSIVFPLRASLKSRELDLSHFGGEGQIDLKRLWGCIRGSKTNVNAQHDIRESQKRNLEKRRDERLALSGENNN